MLPQVRPDAVFIDLDDTLIDHTQALVSALWKVSQVTGDRSKKHLQSLFDKSADFHQADDRCAFITRALYHHRMLREKAGDLSREFDEAIRKTSPAVFYADAPEFILALKKKGVHCFLISNAGDKHIAKSLYSHPVADAFDSVWSTRSSSYAFCSKEEIYAALQSKLQQNHATSPVVWIIGDRLQDFPAVSDQEKGTVFRIAASPRCEAYKKHPEASRGRDYVITSYRDASLHVENF